jgi:hypothetical protein
MWEKDDGLYGGGHSEHGAGGRAESDLLASRRGSGEVADGRRLPNFFLWQRQHPGAVAASAAHDALRQKAF